MLIILFKIIESNKPTNRPDELLTSVQAKTERKQITTENVFDCSIKDENQPRQRSKEASLHGMIPEVVPNQVKSTQGVGSLLGSDDVTAILDGKLKEQPKNFAFVLVLIAITSITLLYTSFGALIGHVSSYSHLLLTIFFNGTHVSLLLLQNVLVPFGLFEVYVFMVTNNGDQKQTSSLFNTALMLSGLPQHKLSQFTKIIWTVKTLLQDLCVYLFACLICYQIYTIVT